MSNDKVPVLALDGPSGSGKGTVGQLLAERLRWHFLDSGALYRALGFEVGRLGIDINDKNAIARVTANLDVRFVPVPAGEVRVVLNGVDAGDTLRTEEVARRASVLAPIPEVRAALLQKQHAARRPPGLVADGRDMGSKVFPDAVLKVFLTASPETRAERRYKQLKLKGFDVNLRELLQDIRSRDQRDAEREASPLKPAKDAYILDTSDLAIPEVVDRIERWLNSGNG